MMQNTMQSKSSSRQKYAVIFNGQVSDLISVKKNPCFSVTEDKTECRETHEQTAMKGVCNKRLAEHLKGGKSIW